MLSPLSEITRGLVTAMDCAEHRGLHLFEDLCIYEVVDADNRPVPSGHPGAKVLVPVPAIPRETGAGKLKHVRALGRARPG